MTATLLAPGGRKSVSPLDPVDTWSGRLFITTGQGWGFQWSPHGLHGHCNGGESPDSPKASSDSSPLGWGRSILLLQGEDASSVSPCCPPTPQEWRGSLPPDWKESSGLLFGLLWHDPGRVLEHPVSVFWGRESQLPSQSLLVGVGDGVTIFLWHLAGEWMLTKHSVLLGCPLLSPLARKNRLLLGFFVGFPASSGPSLRSVQQKKKKNPVSSLPCLSSDPKVPS